MIPLIQEIWTNYQAEMLERFPLAEMLPAEQRTLSELVFVSMGEVLKIWCYDSAERSPDDSDL